MPVSAKQHLPALRRSTCKAITFGLALTFLVLTGCQSLHPFAERTRQKIASARQWANGGLEAFQCGRLQQAKGFFQRATEQRPDDFRARANLARTMHQSGETSEAIIQMQHAVEQSGNDPVMIVELGEMYLAAGQYSPAMRQVNAALRLDHRLANAWKLKGKIERSKGQLTESLANLQKASGYDPDQLDIQMEIAKTYQAAKQPLKALASLENLLAKHPADSQPESAILAKADVLMDLEQFPAAIATLQRARRQQDESEQILVRLAQAQIMSGQIAQARSTISQGRQELIETPLLDQLQNLLDDQLPKEPSRLVNAL